MAYYLDYLSNTKHMKLQFKRSEAVVTEEPRENFHLGATILLTLLFLVFIGTTFYLGISVYLDGL